MIIRAVFLVLLALLTFYVFIQRRRLPFNLIVMSLIVVAAVAFILRPEMSDPIANYLGVGTGADLITYLIQVGLIFATVHYYTKFSTLQSEMTKVVRELALLQHKVERLTETEEQTGVGRDRGRAAS
ncbi:MAG: DUF2304 domain-containing protein [Proteobacteria bacterium]|nr:DUF2304 domain-containing protein [Pseudomonadota bacterium]